jgi:cytochrome c oxidase subunit 1
MIVVNKVMHNTQWVPGHFHTYLLLGEVAMAFGFMAWLARRGDESLSGPPGAFFWAYAAGGTGFVVMFLISGAMSIPRRWAVHLPQWHLQAQIASAFAVLVILAAAAFVLRYLMRLGKG